MRLLQLLEDRQPVLVGELHVHHHEIRDALLDLGEGGLATGRQLDGVPLLGEEVLEKGADVGVVVDDEHGAGVSQ